jgi:hypothetical protein
MLGLVRMQLVRPPGHAETVEVPFAATQVRLVLFRA